MRRPSFLFIPSGFDRDLKLLLCSMMSRRAVMGFTSVVVTIYYNLIGLSPVTIGLLLSFSSAISALHHVSFGVLSDRYGRKPFLLLGAFFATMRLLILATTKNIWLLVLGQGLGAMGEGAGAGQPVVSGYIADKVELKDRVSTFSVIAVTNALAATAGSAIAGLPQWLTGLQGLDLVGAHGPLFLIGAALSALSFMLLLPISEVEAARNEDPGERRGFKIRSWEVILKYSLVRSMSGLGWGLIESLLPLYFYLRFGVGSDVLGPIYAASRMISIVTYASIPFVVGRLGDVGTIALSRMGSAAATIAFAFTDWYPLAAGLLVVFRLLMEFTMPVRQSFATGIVDQDETATMIGISSFARMGVRTAAPAIAGYMFEAVSLSMPLLLGSALTVANGALYYAFFRPRDGAVSNGDGEPVTGSRAIA